MLTNMISLQLAKLSTAQDASLHETKFSWSHETQDLVLVFQNYGANGSPSQLLKVTQGTQVRVRASLGRHSQHRTQDADGVCHS
jgi:hypothetical protein